MSEAQKYSFNKEDYERFGDIDSDINGLKFKEARKAKLQGLTIQDAPQGYALVEPVPAAPANAAPASQIQYVITFDADIININTKVIKELVDADKGKDESTTFKWNLKTKIGDLNTQTNTITDKLSSGADVKTIILEAYVHQNVIKILTIVYAYFVLIEITSGKGTQDKPEPEPKPKPTPTPPKIQDDIINPQDVTLTAFFGNLFDPFHGKAEYVAKLEELAEKNDKMLENILNGKEINIPQNNDGDQVLNALLTHLGKNTIIDVYNPDNSQEPKKLPGGYNAAIQNNIESLKGALAGSDEEKDQRAPALAGLLRRMQYYRAKKGFGQGGPSAAANNDLLKFVLDTFPLFTKMSVEDVNTVGVQLGGKILKKKH